MPETDDIMVPLEAVFTAYRQQAERELAALRWELAMKDATIDHLRGVRAELAPAPRPRSA